MEGMVTLDKDTGRSGKVFGYSICADSADDPHLYPLRQTTGDKRLVVQFRLKPPGGFRI